MPPDQKDPNRLHWYDGQILSSHDFHQNDNLTHYKISYLNSITNPYTYGVIQLEIDQAALSTSTLRLTQLECLMPDYTHIILPMYQEKPPEMDLTHYQNQNREYIIYCNLPTEHSLMPTDFNTARYKLVNSTPVPDHSNNSNPKVLTKLMPMIQLSTEPNGIHLPLLKFSFSTGTLKLIDYDYPSPDLRKCHHTFRRLKTMLESLQNQLEIAISKIRLKNNTEDFNNYGYLILQELCPMFALLNSTNPNPFQVYLSTSRLMGTLSRIITDQYPRLDLYYNHLEIYQTYLQVITFIEQKIDRIKTLHSLDLLKFDAETENKYKILLKNFDSPYLYLLIQFNEDTDYEKWIKTAIIASQTMLQSVIIQKTTGCTRKIIEMNRIDSVLNVKVEVKFDTSNVKDNLIYIVNYINKSDIPINIYLLLG